MEPAQELALLTTLARIDERTEKLDHIVFGNGRAGLLERTAELEKGEKRLRDDLEQFTIAKVEEARRANELVVATAKAEVKQETPSKGAARFAQWASVSAFIAAVVSGVLTALKTS